MEQLTQFAPFLLMFVIYFFMIRPQQKKLKRKRIWKYFKSRW
jgi:preprotein translocase subunit YajC